MNLSDSADAEVGSILTIKVSPTDKWDPNDYKPPMPIHEPKHPRVPPYWPIIPLEENWTTKGMGITGYQNVQTGETRRLNDPPFKHPEYPWKEMGRYLTKELYHRPVAPCYLNQMTGECKWDFPDVPLSSFEFKTPSLNPSEFTKYVKRPQHVRAINAPTHPHTTHATTSRWGITKMNRSLSSAFTHRKAGGHKNKRSKRRKTKRRKL